MWRTNSRHRTRLFGYPCSYLIRDRSGYRGVPRRRRVRCDSPDHHQLRRQHSFRVLLEASRKGQDHDGRCYTIFVRVSDKAGNRGEASAIVTVRTIERKTRHGSASIRPTAAITSSRHPTLITGVALPPFAAASISQAISGEAADALRRALTVVKIRRFVRFCLTRRDGRVVDGGGLENHCTRKGTGGSNPSPSARLRSPFGRASSRRATPHGEVCRAEAASAAKADVIRLRNSSRMARHPPTLARELRRGVTPKRRQPRRRSPAGRFDKTRPHIRLT